MEQLLNPVVQGGALGLCVLLISLLAYQVKSAARREDKIIEVVDHNSTAMTMLIEKLQLSGDQQREILQLLRRIDNKLLSRPCIARKEPGGGND